MLIDFSVSLVACGILSLHFLQAPSLVWPSVSGPLGGAEAGRSRSTEGENSSSRSGDANCLLIQEQEI